MFFLKEYKAKKIKAPDNFFNRDRIMFSENKNFMLVRDVIKPEDFHSSICMITDWSGIGLEYSFTTKNKVFFIDVPQKIINSEFKFLSIDNGNYFHNNFLT